jgi:hypothetical protein
MSKILNEILAANHKYAEIFGDKAPWHSLWLGASRYSPVRARGLIRQNSLA